VQSPGSCGTEKAGAEEVQLCAAVHLGPDEFEFGDVPIGLAIGPSEASSSQASRPSGSRLQRDDLDELSATIRMRGEGVAAGEHRGAGRR
jgi:hypothetical protein